MKKGIKTCLVLLCCILAIKSMAISSHFVICDFDYDSSIEMPHTRKIAHDHNEEADNNDHKESFCIIFAGENQYNECTPCSDTIIQELLISKKRRSTKIDFSLNYRSTEKIDTIALTLSDGIIDDPDVRQTDYQPTITILRI